MVGSIVIILYWKKKKKKKRLHLKIYLFLITKKYMIFQKGLTFLRNLKPQKATPNSSIPESNKTVFLSFFFFLNKKHFIGSKFWTLICRRLTVMNSYPYIQIRKCFYIALHDKQHPKFQALWECSQYQKTSTEKYRSYTVTRHHS